MELTNFGSIMKFAIDRETEIKGLLEEAKANGNLSSLSGKIEELSDINHGNLKILERTRREGICELVLHPINGLDAGSYTFAVTSAAGISERGFLTLIGEIGKRLSKFYSEAGEKLPADDAKRAFQKLAKKRYEA